MKLHYVALRKHMFLYMDLFYSHIFKWKGSFPSFKGVVGVSSLPGGRNGVSGKGVVKLWASPLLESDLNSWCLTRCVGFIVLNTVVLAVLEVWYWKYSEVLSSCQSLCLSLDECQGPRSTSLASVMGNRQFQSVATRYRLDNTRVRESLHNTFTFYP